MDRRRGRGEIMNELECNECGNALFNVYIYKNKDVVVCPVCKREFLFERRLQKKVIPWGKEKEKTLRMEKAEMERLNKIYKKLWKW